VTDLAAVEGEAEVAMRRSRIGHLVSARDGRAMRDDERFIASCVGWQGAFR
jgi:hypothetical protein